MNYPSIRNLERAPEILCLPEIIATEKIHGMSWRILIPEGASTPENLRFGSRGSWATDDHPTMGAAVRECRRTFGTKPVPPDLGPGTGPLFIFGEIFGPSVQKEIRYLPEGFGFRVFDIARNDRFWDWADMAKAARRLGLELVPELYRGRPDPAVLKRLVAESSTVGVNPGTEPREGIVIRPPRESVDSFGERMIAKYKVGQFADHESTGKPIGLESASGEAKLIGELGRFASRARIVKGASVLRENNRYRRAMADMPALVEVLWKELEKEESGMLSNQDCAAARSYLARILSGRYASALREDVLPPKSV